MATEKFKIHEAALEILRENSLMTMKEAVELAREMVRNQDRDQERPCNLPSRRYCPDCGEVGEIKGHQTCQYPKE